MFGNPYVTVHTDHSPLEQIFTKPLNRAPKKLFSMLLALQGYPIKVLYKPGVEQVTADMLSRASVDDTDTTGVPDKQIFTVNQLRTFMSDLTVQNLKRDLPVCETTHQHIKQNTKDDLTLSMLQSMITSGWPAKPTDVPEQLKEYHAFRDKLAMLDGVIYKGLRLVFPANFRSMILDKQHTSHQGTATTVRRARAAVF